MLTQLKGAAAWLFLVFTGARSYQSAGEISNNQVSNLHVSLSRYE